MCTLIALWRCHPAAPLVLALNRDESLERPSRGLHLWPQDGTERRIVAGKDLRAGGTWFGIGEGVVAALTNQRRAGSVAAPGSDTTTLRSRGEIVLRALQQSSTRGVERELGSVAVSDYGPFHLLACDGQRMSWLTNRSGELESSPVAPGVHVLGNDGLDDRRDPVVARLGDALQGVGTLVLEELDSFLRSLLARSGKGWPCVHLGRYGTCSSAILRWGAACTALLATEGPPCVSPWQDLSPLLDELRSPRPRDGERPRAG